MLKCIQLPPRQPKAEIGGGVPTWKDPLGKELLLVENENVGNLFIIFKYLYINRTHEKEKHQNTYSPPYPG